MADVLKRGGSLGPDVIANLIAARLNRRDVFHRGYVVDGSNYEDFVSSRIEDIFTTWPIKPSVIVYVMCPDEDVLTKREHLRLDPVTGRIVDTSFTDTSKQRIETLFSRDRIDNGANVSLGLYQELTNEDRQGKYLLKRPSDERSNARRQCALYKRLAMPTIEKWILLHNPQNVIRVDGRTPMSSMFQIFVARTRTLPLPRVILPRRFTDHTALELEGESPVVTDEFDDESNEEAFRQLTNRETVSPLFPWGLSSWGFLCPVELARGRTVEGLARQAVRFMNKIFFLSSNEAADLFVENPRTFVRPFSPRPTCKIVVFGPDHSGKSELCRELARVLKGTVINAREMDESKVVEAVRNVPREEVDVEVWRDGGYIVDGLYPGIDAWRTIVEDSEITFEDAILLFDDDPYDHLLSKWREIRGSEDGEEFEGTNLEDLDAEGNEGQGVETLVEYIRHIQKFQLDWETMRERVTDDCRNLVACNVGKITDVSKYVIDGIKDRYKDKARVMSEEEKERERDLAEYIGMTDTENIEEEEEEVREATERIHTIDLETAEALLDRGYYLPSSFGRWCPVQLRENKVPLQMFLPSESAREIHPVVHRQFVYFIVGKDAQTEFANSPFEYLEQDSRAPVVPFRLSVVGPPKCGKTTLARRFARKYNVKVITRGAALRHVVEHFPWTESARSSESSLRKGRTVPSECVLRAVEMYSVDPHAVSQGFVLDGFPSSRREFEELTFLGLQPMIVLDLKANLDFSLECLSREADRASKPANFSSSFLSRRFAIWETDQQDFRAWLKSFTQNVIELDATKCAWHAWTVADRQVCSRYAIVRSYFRESDYDKVHSLRYMSVSPYEFRTRQSRFESYCPLCLYHENAMRASGPPDHEGMVQFREHFYWICPQHMQRFIQDPRKYLPPANTSYPPKDRPRVLTETIDLEHPCWAKRLRVGGFCSVTYVDSLPSRKLARGESTTAVLYRDNLYLFCTEGCRDKFLAQPGKYENTEIKFLRRLPKIDVKSLPDLGFLEQTVSKLIIEAVNRISVDRPKLPARRVPVPDTRFDYLCEYFKPASKVPAFLNVVDIAGLVKGASEGQGLGNSFLSHINACDGIFHLCRAFDDDDVTHVEGDVNPVRDLEIISEELRLKDIEFLNGHLEKLEKLVVRGNDKKLKPEYDTLLKVKGVMVDEKRHIRFADWSATDIEVLNKYLFLTSKPVIYLVNLSEKDYIRKKNKWLIKIKEWVDKNDPGAVLIPFSGVFENKLLDMDDAERAKYLEENKVTSALDKIIVQGYKALQLQYFFTAGHDEVKAWTIQKGTKAPQAAGKIHTDFEKGFIMAEVMKFDDFKNEGSEAAVKAAGKYRQQGRNYVVEDGDIIFFKFNAGAGLKDAKKK
ncbi:hypothetical protein WN51_12951 [Melipona quadrifasciata]|uniref:Obg-like ATPase 1 n=1 Tax=Melipona quadrifasciata TaxID=166423 RepID=A0A0N0BKE4_9HYME|nr:hypothetical protein WN51_12951 [Melipona quadrifasciata]